MWRVLIGGFLVKRSHLIERRCVKQACNRTLIVVFLRIKHWNEQLLDLSTVNPHWFKLSYVVLKSHVFTFQVTSIDFRLSSPDIRFIINLYTIYNSAVKRNIGIWWLHAHAAVIEDESPLILNLKYIMKVYCMWKPLFPHLSSIIKNLENVPTKNNRVTGWGTVPRVGEGRLAYDDEFHTMRNDYNVHIILLSYLNVLKSKWHPINYVFFLFVFSGKWPIPELFDDQR